MNGSGPAGGNSTGAIRDATAPRTRLESARPPRLTLWRCMNFVVDGDNSAVAMRLLLKSRRARAKSIFEFERLQPAEQIRLLSAELVLGQDALLVQIAQPLERAQDLVVRLLAVRGVTLPGLRLRLERLLKVGIRVGVEVRVARTRVRRRLLGRGRRADARQAVYGEGAELAAEGERAVRAALLLLH